jgi:amidase
MRYDEYAACDATALAALVARREVTAAELLDCALARLAAVGPVLNPIAIDMAAIGRARVAEPLAGPFAGVPFLLTDWFQDFQGQPNTGGCRGRVRWISEAHGSYTQRCLDAGLVVFGRTTTPELCLVGYTETALYGITRNPWAPGRTPGGSSGGAAASVAAGIVPMAGASDGGGSIRIPASYCGLFGFRPGRGVVPQGPQAAEGWEGANSDFVLTRSVRDAASMLDVLAGGDAGAPYRMPRPAIPYAAAILAPPARLRIGLTTESPIGAEVHPEAAAAAQRAGELLQRLGHQVEPASPAIDGPALARVFLDLYLGQVAADVAATRARTGAGAGECELTTRGLGRLGRAMPAGDYVTSHRQWNVFGRALAAFFTRYDMLLLPAVAGPPPRIGELAPGFAERLSLHALAVPGVPALVRRSGALEALARTSLARTPFTQLSNLTGTPSMSVPLHWAPPAPGEPEVPFGAQFVAPTGGEALLLALAAELEAAQPWAGRRPPELHAA